MEVKVPKQAFLGLVEGFLNTDYKLCLWVQGVTEKKTFGCDKCGGSIEAWSPDDTHTTLRLEKEKDSIERNIKCPKCEHANIRYWVKQAGPVFLRT